MTTTRPSQDEILIWDINSGDQLTATRDLVMDYPATRCFTRGKTYTVASMHPIANPPFIRAINDQGDLHGLEAEHLREYFGK